jgi:tRNA A37 N6-isopentenylltransferase MiaA
LLDVVAGRSTLVAAREQIAAQTRHYARRQRTYVRGRHLDADAVIELRDPARCPWPRLQAFLEVGADSP